MSCEVHLSKLVADQTNLWFAAQGAHWNVVGDDFVQMHDFFGDLADDVLGSIDPTAENIRKLGFLAPSTLDQAMRLRQAPKVATDLTDPTDQLKAIRVLNNALLGSLNEAFSGADSENYQGIANFLADRIDMHEKWRWQIDSMIGMGGTKAVDAEDKREEPKEKPAPKKRKPNPVLKKIAPMTARPPKVDR